MTSPTPDSPAVAPRPVRVRKGWDIALSVVFLVLALGTGLIAGLSQAFIFVFTDYCPAATCHIEQGITGVGVTWTITGIIGLIALVSTIILLIRRRRAWWVALIGLVVTGAGAIVAFVIYIGATGGF